MRRFPWGCVDDEVMRFRGWPESHWRPGARLQCESEPSPKAGNPLYALRARLVCYGQKELCVLGEIADAPSLGRAARRKPRHAMMDLVRKTRAQVPGGPLALLGGAALGIPRHGCEWLVYAQLSMQS